MSTHPPTLLWFRNDLRVEDNAALNWAAEKGAVVAIYIDDTSAANLHPAGAASRWWLQEALQDLARNLEKRGCGLILRRGDPLVILPELVKETNAQAVAWSRCYEPHFRQRDAELEKRFLENGTACKIHASFLLHEPENIRTSSGTPFKVFTPFSKACFEDAQPAKALSAPKKLQSLSGIPSDHLNDWKLVPRQAKWPKGLAKAWNPTESAAHAQLQKFIDDILQGYKQERDRMDHDGTSRLSPYLHFGQLGPRQVWRAVQNALAAQPERLSANAERYMLEILWREFSWHLLHHFPAITTEPLQPNFSKFPWRQDEANLKAWQQGQTGYPIVDAAMRQLWQTGWMHNRARMIVASFLVKHLLLDWREGMAWFWDTLVDADLGNNTASWQWVAGCGADAAPYFRIFNPVLQGQKFDPDGDYVRRFVPELAKLGTEFIHEPWTAPPLLLSGAGVTLGKTYPMPIVDHKAARQRALAAFAETRK